MIRMEGIMIGNSNDNTSNYCGNDVALVERMI